MRYRLTLSCPPPPRNPYRARVLAFTLAEVLITLGIIGIVAALTIPSITAKYQEKATVTRLKATYNMLQNAVNLAMLEHGTVDKWFSSSDSTEVLNNKFGNIILKYIKHTDICGTDTKCKENTNYESYPYSYVADLINGTKIYLNIFSPECISDRGNNSILKKQCGWIDIDLNGEEKPNKLGYDQFEFMINKDGIFPYGLPDMVGVSDQTISYFKETCSDLRTQTGFGCAAWVIMNENTDYLECPGKLDWNGPLTCK